MTTPSVHIDYSANPIRLRAHLAGYKGTMDSVLAYWQEIAAEVRRRRPPALLVVDEMKGETISRAQMKAFVDTMADLGARDVRVAYVDAHGKRIARVEVARDSGAGARF